MNQLDSVIAIVGPTASGKTSLSIELAKRLDGEIINGDAMQVYKGLNIGTAKIKEDEKEGITHHLFDIKEPTDSFSVAEYQSTVRSCIEDIRNRGQATDYRWGHRFVYSVDSIRFQVYRRSWG